MNLIENACLLVGRGLLGLYFILPAISKIADFPGTSAYMAEHHVPFIPILLVLTIALQLICGLFLIVGFYAKIAAFLLAGLTLVISIFMHNFWDMTEAIQQAHETQNFVKNMAIFAGLLIVAALGTGKFSVDNRS